MDSEKDIFVETGHSFISLKGGPIACPCSSVFILGKQWSIRAMYPPDDQYGYMMYGQCDYRDVTIKIQPGMPLDMERQTVLHETLHAIDTELMWREGQHETCIDRLFRFDGDPDKYDNITDVIHTEGEVRLLSAGMFSLFSDERNHELMKWIMGIK